MSYWITRARPGAEDTARRLTERGLTPIVSPLLNIRFFTGHRPGIPRGTHLIFTSTNGVRAFARRSGVRDRTVWCVGDATAAAAREAGFKRVYSASGDGDALLALILNKTKPEKDMIHVGGTHLAKDIAAGLRGQGYTARHEALYESEPAIRPDPVIIDALSTDSLTGVLFHSPRAAAHYARLIQSDMDSRVKKYCISANVADALSGRTHLYIAGEPTEKALLSLLPDANA